MLEIFRKCLKSGLDWWNERDMFYIKENFVYTLSTSSSPSSCTCYKQRFKIFFLECNKTFQLFHIATVPTANEKFFLTEKKGWQENTPWWTIWCRNNTTTMIALTLCYCSPRKTPTSWWPAPIGVEVDIHFVRFGCYDRRLEVKGMRWSEERRVAAAVVHQGRPIPIGDSDKVARAGGDTVTNMDGKGGEFKPQYLSSLHSNVFYFVNVIGIFARIVWWGDHTWGNSHWICSKRLTKFKKLNNSQSLLNHLQCHILL